MRRRAVRSTVVAVLLVPAGCSAGGVAEVCDVSPPVAVEDIGVFDAPGGSVRWRFASPEEGPSFLGPTLGVVGDVALAGFGACDVVAIDVATGAPVWTADVDVPIGAAAEAAGGFAPAGALAVVAGRTLLEPATGEIVATVGPPPSEGGTWAADDRVIVMVRKDLLLITDISDPEAPVQLDVEPPWALQPDGGSYDRANRIRQPALSEGIAVVSVPWEDTVYGLEVGDGSVVWTVRDDDVGVAKIDEVAVEGSQVFGCARARDDRAVLVRLDVATGGVLGVHPAVPEGVDSNDCYGAPMIAGDSVVLTIETQVSVLDLAGNLRWSTELARASAAATNGRTVVVGTVVDEFVQFDAVSGAELQRIAGVPSDDGRPVYLPDGTAIIEGPNGRITAVNPP